jgi:hypothetical protein
MTSGILEDADRCEVCRVRLAVPGSRQCLDCRAESPVDEEGI